jgi:arginyl-tRNA synthetase
LVNDRGIHICKSMLAWQKWGNGETPESSGIKGDHLVGKYYVIFDKEYKKEIEALKLMAKRRKMLKKCAANQRSTKNASGLGKQGDIVVLLGKR